MASKQRRGGSDAAEPKQRLNVRIHPEAYERLMVHCIKQRKQAGEFVEQLIEAHCRSWKVQVNNPTSTKGTDRLDVDVDVNLMATSAA